MNDTGTHLPAPFEQRFYSVPPALPYEPLSCWLGRFALSQGVYLQEVADFLQLDRDQDIDMTLPTAKILEIIALCGLPKHSFDFCLRIFRTLSRISPTGAPFLLKSSRFAGFRYCAKCLSAMRTPYFPLHWRFDCWQWCPVHNCFLEDRCPHCRATLRGPVDQVAIARNVKRTAALDRCWACGDKLTEVIPHSNHTVLTRLETIQIINGRAALAALYAGRVDVQHGKKLVAHPLSHMLLLHRHGLLPTTKSRRNFFRRLGQFDAA